jgi:pimeloyl-ACP methyl ester carboxylesterase
MPLIDLPTGVRLNYLDINPEGRATVLLLHGLGVNGASWALQFQALSEAGYRSIAPDARGFGQTRCMGGGITVARLAEDMAALLEALHLVPAHVVGISMGGVLALQLALTRAQMIEKLVLVNTFARLRPERPSVWAYFALRMLMVHTLGLEAQARAVARRVLPREDQAEMREIMIQTVRQADPRAYRATMRALALFDVQDRLREIRLPTLLVTGADDNTVPPPLQRRLLLGILGAQQVIIPKAGHAVTADQPEAFNRVLLDFLES